MKLFKYCAVFFPSALVVSSAPALTATVNGIEWTYTVSGGQASVGNGSYSGDRAVPTSTSGAITIPSKLGGYPVTSIGNYAFDGCSGLTSVAIPDSVTSIGRSAFDGCSGLTGPLAIPASVTSIGNYAFWGCSGLTGPLAIPASVTSIGNYAFRGCSGLTSFSVGVDNANYSSVNGLLLTKDGKTLIAGINHDVVIPASVTSIGDYAFYGCSGLTSVAIPASVTSIGDCAFYGCSGLTSVAIPASVTSIGDYAFYGCSGLTGPLAIPASMTSIGDYAFRDCSGLTGTLTIPSSVTSIGDYAFERCSGLTSVIIPDSVTRIGDWAFFGCSGLTGTLTIGKGLTSLGESAFCGCSGLTAIQVVQNNQNYDSRNNCNAIVRSSDNTIIAGCKSSTIPSSVTSIGDYAFERCSGLTSVIIPDSVTNIGDSAFAFCFDLSSVTIGKGVTSIGNGAFGYCIALKSVTIPTSVMNIGDCAFEGCRSLTSIAIPDSVRSIGMWAFYDCDGLTSVIIGKGVTSIGDRAFYQCSGLTGTLTIPDSVTNIGDSAFSSCFDLSTVTIGKGVTSIGDYVFAGCSGLTSVTIPSSVTSIGTSAFAWCYGLTTVIIPTSVTSIGSDAFYDCNGLKHLFLPYGLSQSTNSLGIPASKITLYDPSSYKIAFNANGGTGTMAPQDMVYDTAAKLQNNSLTRKGFVFIGWAKSKTGAVVYANQASVKNLSNVGGTVTLYAVWANATYMVAFDANGGKLPTGKTMAPQKMTYGKAATLRKNVFTRKGHVFIGWAKSKTGAVAYKNGAAVKNLRADGKTLTLYAVWAKKTYSVAFDANGGKGKMATQTMTFGTASNLAKNAFTRKGWLFIGWAKTPDGAVAYKNKAEVKNLRTDGKTTTLYAVWEKAQTVNFNPNGGTCDVAYRDYKVGKAYGALPVPARKWYAFSGWYTAATDGTLVTQFDKAEDTKTRTLYAQWASMPILLDVGEKSVGPAAATKVSVGLNANATWKVDTDASWISLRTQGGKAGRGSVVFDVAENNGVARTGNIIVSANGIAALLTVNQSAKTLAVSPTTKTHSYKAASSQKITVNATIPWTAKSSASWLKLKTVSGKGAGTLVYSIAENKAAGRMAKITISGGGMTAVVEVIQKGKNGSTPSLGGSDDDHYLVIHPDAETFSASGATNETAVVLSDISWKATASPSWIVLETTSGSGSGEIAYRVETNTTSRSRSGAINVTGGGMKATLTIEQTAATASPYLVLTPDSGSASSAATSGTIWVDSNVAWTATPECTWLTLDKKSGNGTAGVKYTVAANPSTASRTATVFFDGGGICAEFTLTQEGTGNGHENPTPDVKFLRVNPTSALHGGGAGKGGFMVESNVPWIVNVSQKDSWIIVKEPLSGSNSRQVDYSFGKNDGGRRTGTIVVVGDGLSATFTVVQESVVVPPPPPPPPETKELTINGEEESYRKAPVGKEGETVNDCCVETSPNDLSWRVYTGGTGWIHPDFNSAKGSRILPFTVDANLNEQNPYRETSPRRGCVTVRSGILKARYFFMQEGFKPYLSVTPTDYYYKAPFSWRGGSATSTVFANIPWTAKVTKGGSWIHIQESFDDGNGSGRVVFTVDKNENTYDREGSIIVYDTVGNGKSATIWIKQGAAPILVVTPDPKTVTNKADSDYLSIRSNVPWTATAVSQDNFITLLTKKGNPNQTLRFTFTENKKFESRTGYITVSGTGELGKGKSVKIKVVQKGKPTLTVSPASKKVNYKAQSDSFTVKANVSWTATAKVSKDAKGSTSWFALATKSGKAGSNPVNLTFKVTKNTTGKSRTAAIVLKGGGLARRVTVTQAREPKLSLSPSSRTVAYDAVDSWFYVTSDVKWTAKSSADWLKVDWVHVDASGAKNGGYVEYDADENTTASKRSATITVTGGGKSATFTLTQNAKPLPNLCFYKPNGWPKAVFVTTGMSLYYMKEETTLIRYRDEWAKGYIKVCWKNTGGVDIGKYKFRIDYGDDYPDVVTQSGLAKGKTAEECIYLSYNYTGSYTVTIMLDPDNAIKESDETDNTATVSFTVVYSNDSAYGGRLGSPFAAASSSAEEFVEADPKSPTAKKAPIKKAEWVAVIASGGENIGAVADGDEETSWVVDANEGAWVVLSFAKPRQLENVELIGDNLPEDAIVFFSDDSEAWQEEPSETVQYVMVVFPAGEAPIAVNEIRIIDRQ